MQTPPALAAAVLAVSLLGAGGAAGFRDVPSDLAAAHAVRTLAEAGIVTGYPDGTFRGERPITRYEMALMLDRMLARMHAERAAGATKFDLDALHTVVESHADELAALERRMAKLEDAVPGR